jgi:hypothetical protein
MSELAYDSMAAAVSWQNIVDRNPELGGPVVKHPTGGGNFYSVNGRAICRTAGVNYYNVSPPSADYTVSADIRILDSTGAAGVVGRCNPSTSTWYHPYIAPGNNELAFVKWVNGYPENIESVFGMGFASGQIYTLTLEMAGTDLNVYINGDLIIEQSDSDITAAGKGGIRAGVTSNTSTGKHIDNLRIFDATTPPAARRKSSAILLGI